MPASTRVEPPPSGDGRNELATAPARLGHYRILDVLGSGLLTTVYRAEAEGIGRIVALKVLKSKAGPDSAFHRRFEREAKLLSSLHHTNLIELYDFDVGAAGERPPYMVLEHIDGATLAEVLQRLKRLEPEEAAALALEVARALPYAHAQGVVHRDVKPGNVLIGHARKTGAGDRESERSSIPSNESATLQRTPRAVVVKLVDFGIARESNERPDPALVESGDDASDAVGTPAYMAPEQLLGETVDHRADHFALGIVLYQMLAGARPFDGDDGRPAIQRVRRDPPRPFKSIGAVVPRTLERIVLRCLAKRPADRYASTNELVDELQRFLDERAPAGNAASDLSGYHRRVLARAGVLDERRAIREEAAVPSRPTRNAPIRMRAVPLAPAVVGIVVACVALIAGGGVIQWRGGGIRGAHASNAPSAALPAELPLGEIGWLRVNVRPWADVVVDGVRVDTTPFARPLRVRAGRHVVELVHPSARERKVIDVRVGETTTLDVTLPVPTKEYADEFSEAAPSASIAPVPSGKETPFGVPSTLSNPQGQGGGK